MPLSVDWLSKSNSGAATLKKKNLPFTTKFTTRKKELQSNLVSAFFDSKKRPQRILSRPILMAISYIKLRVIGRYLDRLHQTSRFCRSVCCV